MSPRTRRARRSASFAGLALVLALAAGACGTSQFQYVRNSDTGTGFKIPSGWAVYDKDAFLRRQGGPSASTPDPIQWLVALDGDPSPSVGHVLNQSNLSTDHPEGLALVFKLSPENRDQASLSMVRNFLVPIDQLLQLGSDNAVMMSYDDSIGGDANLRGVRFVFEFRPSALGQLGTDQGGVTGGGATAAFSDDFVVVDQSAYLDSNSDNVYLMALMCSADCYDRYKTQIDNSIGSWTVKP
jgi:hypothetical protein